MNMLRTISGRWPACEGNYDRQNKADAASIADAATLHNGVEMPWLGLGVFRIPEGELLDDAVRWALEAGYRHFDTASIYENETGLGQAIHKSGVPRQELFITSKVWNTDQGYRSTLRAFDASLQCLGLEYLDLYLVHWPVAGAYKDTWQALETLYDQGRVRAIGVSNFLVHHLQDLLADARIPPMVDQIEFHPYLQSPDLQAFCRQRQILLEAWRPIIKGRVNEDPVLVELAEKYGKNPVQLTLRWMIQRGVAVIPKSVHRHRIQSNANIFDFEIEASDLSVIDSLDRHQRFGEDPDNFRF